MPWQPSLRPATLSDCTNGPAAAFAAWSLWPALMLVGTDRSIDMGALCMLRHGSPECRRWPRASRRSSPVETRPS
eukprot:938833-Prymnesium_polylepis.2